MDSNFKKVTYKIHGTHCQSCEVLIERRFKNIPGIEKVSVNHTTGKAKVYCSRTPQVEELRQVIKADGYDVSLWADQNQVSSTQDKSKNTSRDYIEIGAIFLIVVALALLLRQFDLIPKGIGVSENMGYGIIFLIGLVAAVSSCIAVTGGLLLAVTSKYAESHPGMTGIQKFKPHISFNLGRIIGYTMFGGLVGSVGSLFTLSSRLNGIMTIVASVVMILLGFRLLKLFPGLSGIQPRMPKFLAHRIQDTQGNTKKGMPFILGASTFFLPCGFTQALQLYVLSQGDWKTGALTMFVFSLGTLPALLSLGAISSFAKGSIQRYFMKFAGVLVLILGVSSIKSGFALTGLNASVLSSLQKSVINAGQLQSQPGDLAEINAEGKQVVKMKINGLDYQPAQFTVQLGVPVEWIIDGTKAAGCARVVTAPDLNITEYMPTSGTKTISFTPTKLGKVRFSCTMGMTTPGAAFTVVENTDAKSNSDSQSQNFTPAQAAQGSAELTQKKESSVSSQPQRLSMEVSPSKGFYPNTFTIKKRIPVEFEIDTTYDIRGCMSVIVIPQYNVSHKLTKGKTTMKFTPTKSGSLPFTCSMGTYLGEFTVED